MRDSQRHDNSKDSEVTLGIYDILNKGEKRGPGFQILEVRMGDIRVVEEEWNTYDRQILSRQLRNNGTQWVSS